ncbi:hypothetical protein [Actinoplanes sichuanensis]|uniref:Uncharacterized protein n=1 Tax=Actinoplanes sichuanensis TaxID=512349 RepID=A0ABW4A1M9_9ACTN|nr:hypothetical protein [Actinoplanes sichuanensis]
MSAIVHAWRSLPGTARCDDLTMSMIPAMNLPLGLWTTGRYTLESSDILAAKVQAALTEKVDAEVRPVAELSGLATREDVSPLNLLLGLGRLTSALPGLHRIGAAGLPGLTALHTASRWAIIRYLWAFSDVRPDLQLSDLTDEVRSHQRTLLSESFGIALAGDIIERYILPNPSRVVDADAVEYDPVLRFDMAALPSHKPDYFWYREDGGQVSEVVVVEVKGTTSGKTACIKQMARGVAQVLVPAPIHGVKMRRIVIGTELRGKRLRAYAVEVPEPDEAERLRAFEVVQKREAVRPVEFPGLQTPRFAVDVEQEDVDAESFYLDQVRLHAFAGLPVVGENLRQASEVTRGVLAQRETVEADGAGFRCETTRVAFGNEIITVRTGVAEEFLSSTDAYHADGSAQRRAAYRQHRSARGQGLVEGRAVEAETNIVAATAPDGCLLSVSLNSR